MKRRAIVLLLGLLGGTLPLGAAEAGRPNIVFILADDLGWGDLGCYGGRAGATPHLDRLAGEGTLFTHAYMNAPVCSPSRAAILTGLFPGRLRIHGHFAGPEQNAARGMAQFLDPAVPNLPAALKRAGHATAHVGKWHLGDQSGGPPIADYGFDHVGSGEGGGAAIRPEDPYHRARSTALFVDEGLEFIDAHGGRPFYLQLWLLLPHATLNPTPEQLAPFARLSSPGSPHAGPGAIHAASLHDLDTQVGRLLDELERRGLADDTLVVFTSDNGPEDLAILNAAHSGVGSTGPFRGRKRSLYEGGVRVPLLVRWPGRVPAGRVDDTSVISGTDFFPTFARLAGAGLDPAAEAALDGEDMGAVLLGRARARTKPLFWEWRFRIFGHPSGASPQLAIREGDWTLLMNPDRSRVELHAIREDPMQVDNVAVQHPEVVARLSGRLLEWSESLPPGPRDPSAGDAGHRWPKP